MAAQARRAAIQDLAPTPTESVLVAGCGTGLSLPGLSREMWPSRPAQGPHRSVPTEPNPSQPGEASICSGWIEGIDLSPAMLRRARRRRSTLPQSHRIGLRQGDVRALPFPDASFDAVLSCYVLDHFAGRDLRAACREVVRVLRPGGRLVAVHVAPSARFVQSVWQRAVALGVPVLGGSRPVRLTPFLVASCIGVVRRRRITQCGLPSTVLSGEPRAGATHLGTLRRPSER